MDVGNTVVTIAQSFFVLVGTVSGYAFASVNDSKRDKRALEREGTARRAARSEESDRKRHEFQLNTLLELQDALRLQARAAVKVILADKQIVEKQGHFTQLPEGLSDEAFEAGINFGRLMNRVVDKDLRDSLGEFNKLISSVLVPPSNGASMNREEATSYLDSMFAKLSREANTVIDQLGVHLRRELGFHG